MIILTGLALNVAAQDPQFSQYYQNPTYLNPGFTGSADAHRFSVVNRIQWPGLTEPFRTYSFAYDVYKNDLRSGFGVLTTYDLMGSSGWKTVTAGLTYSYKIQLSSGVVFSPGLYFGYGQNGIDKSKLILGDGLEYDGVTLDPDIAKLSNASYFDFGSGFVLYNKRFWGGAAFSHINTPNYSILEEKSDLPMKTTIHGGARFKLKNRFGRYSGTYLSPSFIFKMQGNMFTQLELGTTYNVDPISIGFFYRGKVYQKNVAGGITQDAAIFSLGFRAKDLQIGYSYDFTVSELHPESRGAHEFTLVYQLPVKDNEKKHKLIPCPTFIPKDGNWRNGNRPKTSY